MIIDTNILLSALMTRGAPPDSLYEFWRQGRFVLVSCDAQLKELRGVLARPFFQERIKRSEAGRVVNSIRRLALMHDPTPSPERRADPSDGYLLSLAEVSSANFLVTGDKGHLLPLARVGATQIVTARELLGRLSR